MYESRYYKDDLLKYAKDFEKRLSKQVWREDSLCKAEKHLFVGFYFVRKLLESLKISTKTKKLSVRIFRGKISPDQEISNFNRHKVMFYISEANWVESKVSVDQVCDKVVHSWVNYPISKDDGGLAGFIMTTDRYRNKEMWEIPTESIIEVFNTFGSDYPTESHMKRDESGKITFQLIK